MKYERLRYNIWIQTLLFAIVFATGLFLFGAVTSYLLQIVGIPREPIIGSPSLVVDVLFMAIFILSILVALMCAILSWWVALKFVGPIEEKEFFRHLMYWYGLYVLISTLILSIPRQVDGGGTVQRDPLSSMLSLVISGAVYLLIIRWARRLLDKFHLQPEVI